MPDVPVDRYAQVRARTLALVSPLSPEDAQLQSMPDASPAKWHLAHTTWFFCRFVLGDPPDAMPPGWDHLFNSYYLGAGVPHARAARGLVSRPTLGEVLAWRRHTDARVHDHIARGALGPAALDALVIGSHHEQQHQELLLTDIKHAFWSNPLQPAYAPPGDAPGFALDAVPSHAVAATGGPAWLRREESIASIGAPPWPGSGEAFAYDNETPHHRVIVAAHAIAMHPVRNADFAAFIADGGYATPGLWLSDGWEQVRAGGWQRPLYWHRDGEREFTLAGWQPRDPDAPVRHLSHYEADAFARWAGGRLPTEGEWETAADALGGTGTCWEWTSSAYAPYPGFRPLAGMLGEYNGKFMSGQLVLRGGSCATPPGHARATYRNFFAPHARWQFSGLRLAKDAQ
ncbi:MAG TPA: ergothioneine biosynthesis protein EgtB [Luteimonas sp.]